MQSLCAVKKRWALAELIAGPFLIRRQPSKSSASDFFQIPLNVREPCLLFRVLPCQRNKWWAEHCLMMPMILENSVWLKRGSVGLPGYIILLGSTLLGWGWGNSLSYSRDKLHSSEDCQLVKGNLECAFSHFKEKMPPHYLFHMEGRARYQAYRRQLFGLCRSYLLGFWRADSLCGYTSHCERDSFPVFNMQGSFPIKLQKKVVCICLLTWHQPASYLSAKWDYRLQLIRNRI